MLVLINISPSDLANLDSREVELSVLGKQEVCKVPEVGYFKRQRIVVFGVLKYIYLKTI